MLVREVMTPNPKILSPDMTIQEAAEVMLEQDTGFLPIGENDRLVGTVTDRDIVVRAVSKGQDPTKTPIRDIMSKDVYYCFENDDVDKAAQLMSDLQVRRLIVLNDQKRIVGVISLGDIATKDRDTMLAGETIERISEKD